MHNKIEICTNNFTLNPNLFIEANKQKQSNPYTIKGVIDFLNDEINRTNQKENEWKKTKIEMQVFFYLKI